MRKFVLSISIVLFGIVLLAACNDVLPTPAPLPIPPPEITSFTASRYTLPAPGDPTALSWTAIALGTYTLELTDDFGNLIFERISNDSSHLSDLIVVNPQSSRNYTLSLSTAEGITSKQLRINVPLPTTTPSPTPPSTSPPTTPTTPSSNSSLVFNITDGCNDDYRIDYKFFDVTNNLVWPGPNEIYYTEYYDTNYMHRLSCKTGAKICFGGNTGDYYWGVSKDGDESCTDCCVTCQDDEVSKRLTCANR